MCAVEPSQLLADGYLTIQGGNQGREVFVTQSVLSDSLPPYRLAGRILCPRNAPGKNTGMGSHPLLQGLFPSQGHRTDVSCIVGGFSTI